MGERYVTYRRVSTLSQGLEGYGMDSQNHEIQRYLKNGDEVIAEFSEVESGANCQREELKKAIALCKKKKATLLVARLCRLSRSASLIFQLRDTGVDFRAVDNPHADRFTVNLLAILSERQREIISETTRNGLASAKRRGVKLGNPNPKEALKVALRAKAASADAFAVKLLPVVSEIERAGVHTLAGIAGCLTARGFKSPRGFDFTAQTVRRFLARARATPNAEAA